MVDASTCTSRTSVASVPFYDGAAWSFGLSAIPVRCPVHVNVGDTITEWIVYLQRIDTTPATTARLQRVETVSGSHFDVGPAVTDNLTAPGYVSLHLPGCASAAPGLPCLQPELVNEDHAYSLLVESGGVPGDKVHAYSIYGARP